ncbi:MAG: PD40 domain-containing protein [Anaerolineales bacterium]|nr:PD40 domain-containing protein [Anaerolineales bacterium]
MSRKSDLAPPRTGLRHFSFAILAGSGFLLLAMAWPALAQSNLAQAASPTPEPSLSAIIPTEAPAILPTATPSSLGGLAQGSILLGLNAAGYQQLAWYQPGTAQLSGLSAGDWDDAQPAASPGGGQLAFTSNRSGNWDLYVMELSSGQTSRLSDDAAHDGNPSWSPGGDWLAYEHDLGGNLEIFMRPLDASVDPVPLSNHAAADFEPAWRPGEQQIAFVSARSGLAQLWLLDLEQSGAQRFQRIAASPRAQAVPAWSPDGRWLAWSEQEDLTWTVYVLDMANPGTVRRLGAGHNPQWSPSGEAVLAELRDAQRSYLTGYDLNGGLALAPQPLPGPLDGLAWGPAALGTALQAEAQRMAPAAASAPANPGAELSALDGVLAPSAQLSSAAGPAFDLLRQRTAQLLGWDALSSLDNAFVPLSGLLPPGRGQDWLYTGRAFELHAALQPAGWMAVLRENYAGQTYWRVYLRTARQDGGLGQPLLAHPWDFTLGQPANEIPQGYWIDFTALAAAHGFERPAALDNWQHYYPGTLFSQFTYRQGLSWEAAMLQLYAADELAGLLASMSP